MRTARTGLADDVDAMVAVLYRTNAQSRTIEDALMREGLAYKIVGGVRFYERKEIKDALAYMRLIINPHDDVSLRRVINVPARGIGKGVMESLEAVDPSAARAPTTTSTICRCSRSGSSRRRRPTRCGPGWSADLKERAFSGRAAASLTVFRDLIVSLTEIARQDSVSIAIGKMLDRSGYLQDLREDRSEDGEARIENLAELVSAAREYESREPEPSLGGFVDRLSLLSDVDEEQGTREARIWLMTLHSAKGLEFPDGDPGRPRGGTVPAFAVARGRRRARRRAAAVLRRHDPRPSAAGAHRRGATAGLRRVPSRASRRASSTRCRPSWSIGSRRHSRHPVSGQLLRTTSSGPTRTAAAGEAAAS